MGTLGSGRYAPYAQRPHGRFVHHVEGHKLIIDIAESDATVVITITDDGIGLPQDQWDRVFQPFVRLKTGPAYTGAGLGLTTVKKAAALLGGSVVLESKLDQGAVVTVTLPRNSL